MARVVMRRIKPPKQHRVKSTETIDDPLGAIGSTRAAGGLDTLWRRRFEKVEAARLKRERDERWTRGR